MDKSETCTVDDNGKGKPRKDAVEVIEMVIAILGRPESFLPKLYFDRTYNLAAQLFTP